MQLTDNTLRGKCITCFDSVAPRATSSECAYTCVAVESINCDFILHLFFSFFFSRSFLLFLLYNLISVIYFEATLIFCSKDYLSPIKFILSYDESLVASNVTELSFNSPLLILAIKFPLLLSQLFCSRKLLSYICFPFISLCSFGKPVRFLSLILSWIYVSIEAITFSDSTNNTSRSFFSTSSKINLYSSLKPTNTCNIADLFLSFKLNGKIRCIIYIQKW